MKNKIIIAIEILIILFIGSLFFIKLNGKADVNELILYGNVDIRQVDLGFRVQGKVNTVCYDEGDKVSKGDLLATLDPIPFQEELSSALADLKLKKVNLENAISKLSRREAVQEGAISAEDLEDAYFEKLALEAEVESAQAKVAYAMTHLDDTALISPSPGVILTRIREPGSVLKIGEPIFTLSLFDPIWIRAYVSEPNLGKIYPGMEAEIHLDTLGSKVYKGQIGFISPVAEFTPKSVETTDLRTDLVYRLRIVIKDPDQFLRQGMPVTVKLPRHLSNPKTP